MGLEAFFAVPDVIESTASKQNDLIGQRIDGGGPSENGDPQTLCRLYPRPAVLRSPFGRVETHSERYDSRAWETRRGDWRRLRHDQALVRFCADLGAPNFTNPPQRVALFREFKEGQALRHERRVALLRDLCGRRPVDAAAACPGGIVDEEQKVRGRGEGYGSERTKKVLNEPLTRGGCVLLRHFG